MVGNLPASSAAAQIASCNPPCECWKWQRFPRQPLGIQLARCLRRLTCQLFLFSSTAGLSEALPGDFSVADMICGHPSASLGLPQGLAACIAFQRGLLQRLGCLAWL